MNRSSFFIVSTIATFALTAMPTGAVAQQKSLKEELVGTWMLVQSTGKRPDDSPSWGQNPSGAVVFDANGRYTSILILEQPAEQDASPAVQQWQRRLAGRALWSL